MTRITLVLWLLSTVPAAAFARDPGQQRETVTGDLEVEQLTEDVWRHVSYHDVEGFGRSAGNGLIVVSGRAAALIDTPWTDEQTRDLFRFTRDKLSAEIKVVIASHSHPDCLGGLAAAHQLGARSYAGRKTARLARNGGKPVPQTTFRRRLEVAVGSRTLVLDAAGPGHTADTIVVWIPDEKILFGGCLVRSATAKQLGYTAEADFDRWPKTIETLLERYGGARWIVPGHGRPGGAELLRHTLELLASRE